MFQSRWNGVPNFETTLGCVVSHSPGNTASLGCPDSKHPKSIKSIEELLENKDKEITLSSILAFCYLLIVHAAARHALTGLGYLAEESF